MTDLPVAVGFALRRKARRRMPRRVLDCWKRLLRRASRRIASCRLAISGATPEIGAGRRLHVPASFGDQTSVTRGGSRL